MLVFSRDQIAIAAVPTILQQGQSSTCSVIALITLALAGTISTTPAIHGSMGITVQTTLELYQHCAQVAHRLGAERSIQISEVIERTNILVSTYK